jgi:hypothetical protein
MARVSDWQLERLAADDLPEAEAASLRARLTPQDEARLAELQRSNAEILAALPPTAVAAEVRGRASRSKRWPLWPILIPATAAAALLVFVAVPRPFGPANPADDVTRIKGLAPQLVAFRDTPAGPEELAPGATVRAGDVLQLRYQAAGQGYGAIVSIDGRGGVTLHLPEREGDGAALRVPAAPLPHSYQLDDAPGFERFIFVTSAEPFEVAAVLAAAHALAPSPARAEREPLPLPPALHQRDLLLRKASP